MAIVGPTAVGKTALAVELCRRVGGEIVSIDSRQVYRGLAIAGNAPTVEELRGVGCHLVGVLEPGRDIDAALYVDMARAAIGEVKSRGRWPVLTAGTGLYLKALLEGLDLGRLAPDPTLREQLEESAERNLQGLSAELEKLRPGALATVDRRNPRRVVRRIELAVLEREGSTGTRVSRPPLPALKIGLTAPRPILYQWIEERVDRMLERGLATEVATLLSEEIPPKARVLDGIGIKEMAGHLHGEMSLDAARAAIILRTRRYAKQQWTWYRADPEVTWHDVTREKPSAIVDLILSMRS